jgi:hypothetical protein
VLELLRRAFGLDKLRQGARQIMAQAHQGVVLVPFTGMAAQQYLPVVAVV